MILILNKCIIAWIFNPIFCKNEDGDTKMNESDDEEDYFSIICDIFMILTPKVKDIYCVYDALLSIH